MWAHESQFVIVGAGIVRESSEIHARFIQLFVAMRMGFKLFVACVLVAWGRIIFGAGFFGLSPDPSPFGGWFFS